MGRRLLYWRPKAFIPKDICGISRGFPRLFPTRRYITYVLLTRSPLRNRSSPARLACVRPAASVRSEPGSNSPVLNLHAVTTFPTKVGRTVKTLLNVQ
jgi:hypothetical protein